MIEIKDCKNGWLYKLRSRNLKFGVFTDDHLFTGVREKFSSRFLDDELHWDCGAPYGTAKPLEELEECPIDVLNDKSKLLKYMKEVETRYGS